jgi:Fe-S oxidoreductase
MPGVANFFTQTPLLRDIAKAVAGMAPQRRVPRFASQTFKDWFRRRESGRAGEHSIRSPQSAIRSVILWPDTFNNYFHPEVGQAAVEALEEAGYRVVVPNRDLCCGRPLYDYGFLDLAERRLRRILDELRPDIEAGVPLIGLEPSCLAVFRDELVNLFPHDQDAARLSKQSYLLSEFLEKEGCEPPQLRRKAVVHGHCHHKAIMKMGPEEKTLRKMGLDVDLLDSGCCGMAGAFGFEKGDHYDVSMKCGERVLLPAVRGAAKDSLIIADGFSCREQIAQATGRRALHLAQVIQMAMREGPGGPPGDYPESVCPRLEKKRRPALRKAVAIGACALIGVALIWAVKRK